MGGKSLVGTEMDSHGDHRIAMSFIVAGMRAKGKTTLCDCQNIATSYPNFVQHLRDVQRQR